jgi:thymidine kinase
MFTESKIIQGSKTAGWVEVICGCMFSGKTEELIRRITRAKIARQQIAIFKPAMENRYHSKHVISHNANAIYSNPVEKAKDIYPLAQEASVIGIDEAQFFEADLVDVVVKLAKEGKRVIIAGLDMDYRGQPFGYMPQLMAIAEFVTKTQAVCVNCGNPASFSHRLSPSNEQVLLGETDLYEALCRKCFHEADM